MIAVIIPVRLASKRLNAKALKDIHGKPMIQRMWEGCQGANVDAVYVASADQLIHDTVRGFGGASIVTGRHDTLHARCADANTTIHAETVVIVQGDEPMVQPEDINLVLTGLDDGADMSILVREASPYEDSTNDIKVVTDHYNNVVYISRKPVPGHKAIGIKAFKGSALADFQLLPITYAEREEKLEELRFVLNAYSVTAVKTNRELLCVDTPEDLEKVRSAWKTG